LLSTGTSVPLTPHIQRGLNNFEYIPEVRIHASYRSLLASQSISYVGKSSILEAKTGIS